MYYHQMCCICVFWVEFYEQQKVSLFGFCFGCTLKEHAVKRGEKERKRTTECIQLEFMSVQINAMNHSK